MGAYRALRRKVWVFYRTKGRHGLPWRATRDPYRILVSEVMLQQTQVSRVLPKYRGFLRGFPSFRALAKAPTRKLLTAWQGLGYNRRALNLKRAAQAVVSRGSMPRELSELRKLPGVGPYTARALAALAFGKPCAVVETNIRKVILHEFFPRRTRVADKDVQAVADKLMDKRRPREWNLALMDYGAARFKQGANPNQRSRGYVRQTAFQGSRRQARAAVVRLLVGQGTMSLADIRRVLVADMPKSPYVRKLAHIMGELEQEGFVERYRGRYRIR